MTAHFQDIVSWITTTCNGDSELDTLGLTGTWAYSAPERAEFPYLVIQKQAGTHDYVMCAQAFSSHFLAVKCVDKGFDGGERARLIMDRVQELLDLQTPTISDGGYTLTIKANNSYEYDEQENGNNNFYHSVINFKAVIAG